MLSVPLSTGRFEGARQKADLAATLLKDLGIAHHNGELIFNEAGETEVEQQWRVNNEGAIKKEMERRIFVFGIINGSNLSVQHRNNLFSDTRIRLLSKVGR